jgi:hypothetical protein
MSLRKYAPTASERAAQNLDDLRAAETAQREPSKTEWVLRNQEGLSALGSEVSDILQDWHTAIVGDGIEPDSVAYFARMDANLADARAAVAAAPAMDEPAEVTAPPAPSPRLPPVRPAIRPPAQQHVEPRNIPVLAPVSRENFSVSDGRSMRPDQVRLTREQLEAAAFSNISAAEYARQLLRLAEAKKQGRYQERG